MRKELFEKLGQIDMAKEIIIGAYELRPYLYDRTLIYGYTCERKTFHVYMKNQKIYTVIYERDFKCGAAKPKNMRQIEIKSNREYVPDKRIYPEMCDYHFCCLLKERGIELPFTAWVGEVEVDCTYYGFTLEDIE